MGNLSIILLLHLLILLLIIITGAAVAQSVEQVASDQKVTGLSPRSAGALRYL